MQQQSVKELGKYLRYNGCANIGVLFHTLNNTLERGEYGHQRNMP